MKRSLKIALAVIVTVVGFSLWPDDALASGLTRYCRCWAETCSDNPPVIEAQCIQDWRQIIRDCRTLNKLLSRLGHPTVRCPTFGKRLRRCRRGFCGDGY